MHSIIEDDDQTAMVLIRRVYGLSSDTAAIRFALRKLMREEEEPHRVQQEQRTVAAPRDRTAHSVATQMRAMGCISYEIGVRNPAQGQMLLRTWTVAELERGIQRASRCFPDKKYYIVASALYKPYERRWEKRLSSARFAFALRSQSIHEPSEEILWYLFIRKTPRGQLFMRRVEWQKSVRRSLPGAGIGARLGNILLKHRIIGRQDAAVRGSGAVLR